MNYHENCDENYFLTGALVAEPKFFPENWFSFPFLATLATFIEKLFPVCSTAKWPSFIQNFVLLPRPLPRPQTSKFLKNWRILRRMKGKPPDLLQISSRQRSGRLWGQNVETPSSTEVYGIFVIHYLQQRNSICLVHGDPQVTRKTKTACTDQTKNARTSRQNWNQWRKRQRQRLSGSPFFAL